MRKSDGAHSGGRGPGGLLNGFSRARLNRKPLPVVFVHKEPPLFSRGTIELFTESRRAQTNLTAAEKDALAFYSYTNILLRRCA